MLRLLYGTGMRVLECLRLRVKDVEFTRLRDRRPRGQGLSGSGDDVAGFARCRSRNATCTRVRVLHERDLRNGYGRVYLPYALDRKYPGAATNGAGSTSSRRRSFRRIHAARSPGVTTPARKRSSAPFAMRCVVREWQNRRRPTRCGTRSRRTCSTVATTSARCRNCSATRTCRRR